MKSSSVLGWLFIVWTLIWLGVCGVVLLVTVGSWHAAEPIGGYWRVFGRGTPHASEVTWAEHFGPMFVLLFIFFLVWLVGALPLGISALVLRSRGGYSSGRPNPPSPGQAPGGPYPPAAVPKTSGLAVAGLVLGIAGLCTCGVTSVAGLIMDIVAFRRINRSGGALGGRGVAIGGMVASALTLGLSAALWIAVAAAAAAKTKGMP